MSRTPLPDTVEEARCLVALAAADELLVRVLGGTAIALHAPDLPVALRRSYQDIDLISAGKAGRRIEATLTHAGYTPNERFNALHGDRRQVYYDTTNGRQLDIFVAHFEMCHKLPIEPRLSVDEPTIPLAELLLTKLQIHDLNHKDAADIASILVTHPVGDDDADTINSTYIGELLATDWGLWRTCTATLERVDAELDDFGLDAEEQRLTRERLRRLMTTIDSAPKTLRWRARARIGERARWYEEPDEIEHVQIDSVS